MVPVIERMAKKQEAMSGDEDFMMTFLPTKVGSGWF
jgi:hypothetical protein